MSSNDAKIHLATTSAKPLCRPFGTGIKFFAKTTDVTKVTCKSCIKKAKILA